MDGKFILVSILCVLAQLGVFLTFIISLTNYKESRGELCTKKFKHIYEKWMYFITFTITMLIAGFIWIASRHHCNISPLFGLLAGMLTTCYVLLLIFMFSLPSESKLTFDTASDEWKATDDAKADEIFCSNPRSMYNILLTIGIISVVVPFIIVLLSYFIK